MSDDDDIYDDYDGPEDDCECLEPDVDILTGRAHCPSCGRAWWLTSEEMKREMEIQAQAYEAYAEEMATSK